VIQDDKGEVRCVNTILVNMKSVAGPKDRASEVEKKKKKNRTLLARTPIRPILVLLNLRQVDIPRHTVLRTIPRHRRRRASLRRRRLRLLLLLAPQRRRIDYTLHDITKRLCDANGRLC
jgi:hypothetical protein